MPSITAAMAGLLGGVFKGIGRIDDVVDTAKAVRGVSNYFGGKGVTQPKEEDVKHGGPGQEQIIEQAIFDIVAEYLLLEDTQRKTFLEGPDALKAYDRVAEDFYRRNPKHRDRYEIQLGQRPWWAIGDEGLGTRRKEAARAAAAPQPQKGQQGQGRKQQGGGNQNTPPSPTGVTNLDPIKLMLAIKVCLGKKALAADKTATEAGKRSPKLAGDKVILQAIERFEQASLLEKGKKVLEKGGKNVGDFITGLVEEI